MKRVIAALVVCGIFGAGFVAGSLSPMKDAHAQMPGGGGGPPWPAAAASPGAGSTHFYAIDTGSRTLIACKQSQTGKPECLRQPLP